MEQFLVDTNVWSETVRPSPDANVIAWLRHHEPLLFASSITIGEIRYGIERLAPGQRRDEFETWLAGLCRTMDRRILSFNTAVATAWGTLRARCASAGTTLPAVDGMIAATADHHGLTVATRNTTDFTATGLRTVDPFQYTKP